MVALGPLQTGQDVRNVLYTLQMEKGCQQHPWGLGHSRRGWSWSTAPLGTSIDVLGWMLEGREIFGSTPREGDLC